MFRFRDALATALIAASAALPAQAQDKYPGIGRAATPKEVAAWDIDVRPDFKGLPPGSGTVARGQDLWEERCAVCHGVFGESNTIFTPLVGGTTADDVKTGRVATLKRSDYPGRSLSSCSRPKAAASAAGSCALKATSTVVLLRSWYSISASASAEPQSKHQ